MYRASARPGTGGRDAGCAGRCRPPLRGPVSSPYLGISIRRRAGRAPAPMPRPHPGCPRAPMPCTPRQRGATTDARRRQAAVCRQSGPTGLRTRRRAEGRQRHPRLAAARRPPLFLPLPRGHLKPRLHRAVGAHAGPVGKSRQSQAGAGWACSEYATTACRGRGCRTRRCQAARRCAVRPEHPRRAAYPLPRALVDQNTRPPERPHGQCRCIRACIHLPAGRAAALARFGCAVREPGANRGGRPRPLPARRLPATALSYSGNQGACTTRESAAGHCSGT